MPNTILDKETIKSPQRSRLGLCIDRDALHVMVKDPISETPVYAKLPLDANIGSQAKALEEVIYENPVLLSDFAEVSVSLHSPDFSAVPTEVCTDELELAEAVAEASIADGDSESLATIEIPIAGSGCTLMVKEQRELIDFVRRTFNNPTLTHSLAVQTSYHLATSALGTSGKMFVHLHDDSLDIIIFGDNGISLLNTFSYSDPMDAVYYIMATRSVLGIEQTSGELYLSGEASPRAAITPTLREYLGYVMPLVLPSQIIKAGAPALESPFDLTLLMLCE